MQRDDAIRLIQAKVPNENLRRHMLAVGSVMKHLARTFKEPEEKWEYTGIVHDVDLGETSDPDLHGLLGASWLEQMGVAKDVVDAVKAHANHRPAESRLAISLCAADQITGLIIACALVYGKNLAAVTTESVLKRFKEKRFAAGANRDSIMLCEQVGLSLPEFTSVSLRAMQEIAGDLGL